ncbi:hypothetical protein MF672_017185 [Actinomadura sp. ATCC 31491]|uniref:ATP-binding protein n=1 Tax=Actinomadura luzonensis TaxID=2805427 RepID=A0ABT0FTK9_9ACTN|nr:hypothetical protein [Actinomadura luzonensis]MCK2215508.1 hypothetical protein [Actinomadura luzonensis]
METTCPAPPTLPWTSRPAVRPYGPERTACWTLAARPTAALTAARLTEARLRAWRLRTPDTGTTPASPAPASAARLLAAQLVAAALATGAGAVRLTVTEEDGLLRLEAEHDGPRPATPDAPLLDRLACCWGATGPATWCELPA